MIYNYLITNKRPKTKASRQAKEVVDANTIPRRVPLGPDVMAPLRSEILSENIRNGLTSFRSANNGTNRFVHIAFSIFA